MALKMNNGDVCLVCMKPPEEGYEFVCHHVQYFPEIICFVHYACHAKIHNGECPHLIQYQEGDSRRFYDEKKLRLSPRGFNRTKIKKEVN